MSDGWRFCVFSCFAASLFAQPNVRIEGAVLDADTGYPIAGAKVVLCYSTSALPLATALSDAAGAFSLPVESAGAYVVEASAAGYREARGGGRGIAFEDAAFETGAATSVRNLTLRLVRFAAMEGRVRDADTEEPVAAVTVRAWRLSWRLGRRQLIEERIAFTGADGGFRLDGLPDGDYLVEIASHSPGPKRYPILFWPGEDPDLTTPIHLATGAEFRTGTIDYSKIEFPRLKLKMTTSCPDQTIYRIVIEQQVAGAFLKREEQNVGCRDSLSFDLSPGHYHLRHLAMGRMPSAGTREFTLDSGGNLELEVKPVDPPVLTGAITCDCRSEWREEGKRMEVFFEYSGGLFASPVLPDGSFRSPTLFTGPARVDVRPLPPGLYVKQIVYDGAPVGRFIHATPEVSSSLEIALSDRPAALGGTVMRDGKPVAGWRVAAARWPLTPQGYPEVVSAETGPAGGFTIPGLAPGSYRVAAISPDDWDRRDAPDLLAGWLASGKQIELSENQTGKIVLEIPN